MKSSEPVRRSSMPLRKGSKRTLSELLQEKDDTGSDDDDHEAQDNTPRRRASRGQGQRRITMACTQCRASKLKCDGVKPNCTRCVQVRQSCTWAEADGRSSKRKSTASISKSGSPLDLHLLASTATRHGATPVASPINAATSNQSNRYSIGGSNLEAQRPPPLMSLDDQAPTAIPEQRLWWECDDSSSRPNGVASESMINPLTFDWSTLGLEPHDLTQEVLDTLSGQVAWIDRPSKGTVQEPSRVASEIGREDSDEAEGQVVRMQYFRLLGPTGISPGIKKISMEFRLTPSMRKALFDSDSPEALMGRQRLDWNRLLTMDNAPETTASSVAKTSEQGLRDPSVLFQGDLPAQWVLDELIPIFFDRLGDHYLCLNRTGLEIRLTNDRHRVPPMLLNVICALAARYSTDSRIVAGRSLERSHTFGMEFADKAKAFLAPSLTVPSRTTTLAFLMMAWHEFACNLDSAFWIYAGMALRMAIDLGIHRQSTLFSPRDLNDVDFIDDALLFWAVYQMDRVLAMGTGRPTSIKDREITCPLPDCLDIRSDVNVVFAYHIRHTRIAGKIAESLNAVLSPDEAAREDIRKELDRLEDNLIESYESIPPMMRLTPQNFQASNCKHIFLEFHLRFHCLLLVLNRAPIVHRRTSIDPADAMRIVRKSVQRCADIIALDEAHDGQYLVCIPMGNQTLFLAGCAELDEYLQHQALLGSKGNQSRSSRHLMLDAMESHRHFAAVLERMSIYWDGIRWIYGVLMQRKEGLSDSDLLELDVGTDTIVSKREMRMLQSLHARNPIKAGSHFQQWPPPLQVSEVVSLDELASVLPQFQSNGARPGM